MDKNAVKALVAIVLIVAAVGIIVWQFGLVGGDSPEDSEPQAAPGQDKVFEFKGDDDSSE